MVPQISSGPPFKRQGSRHVPHGSLALACVQVCFFDVFCRRFAAGREEACRVRRGPSPCVRASSIFQMNPWLECVQVGVLAGISLLVGRKRVGSPNFCRNSLSTRQDSLHFPHGVLAGVCTGVGKHVGFPQLLQGSLLHASRFPHLPHGSLALACVQVCFV